MDACKKAVTVTIGVALAGEEGQIEPFLGPHRDVPDEHHGLPLVDLPLLGDTGHGLPFVDLGLVDIPLRRRRCAGLRPPAVSRATPRTTRRLRSGGRGSR